MTAAPTAPGSTAPAVLIVDDHPVFAEALAFALGAAGGFGPVRTCRGLDEPGDGPDDVAAPALVVLDVDLGGESGDGLDLLPVLRRRWPATVVVVLTAQPGAAVRERAARGGAHAVLAKGERLSEVVATLRAALDDAAAAPQTPAGERLSPREAEVLQLLAGGLDARAVARRLDLSVHTVRDHLKAAREKLGVHTQLDAVLAACRAGVIDLWPR